MMRELDFRVCPKCGRRYTAVIALYCLGCGTKTEVVTNVLVKGGEQIPALLKDWR